MHITVFAVQTVVVNFSKCEKWKGLLEEIEPARYQLPRYDKENGETGEDYSIPFADMWSFMKETHRMRKQTGC